MKKYVKCFSNGTEAINWEASNCDRCNSKGCYAKKAIQMGYITGHITWRIAEFVGFKKGRISSDITADSYCTLNDTCHHFNKPIIKKRKDRVIKNTNELTFQFT